MSKCSLTLDMTTVVFFIDLRKIKQPQPLRTSPQKDYIMCFKNFGMLFLPAYFSSFLLYIDPHLRLLI